MFLDTTSGQTIRAAAPSGFRRTLGAAAILATALLTGCTTSYSVDIRNQTPQPVFADVYYVTPQGQRIGLGGTRLGPGDRQGVGPFEVRNDALVTLSLDTVPNPQRPALTDLRPGLTAVEVTQQGDKTAGPLQVRELR